MNRSQDLQNLGQDMLSSFRNRRHDVDQILEASHSMMRNFHQLNQDIPRQNELLFKQIRELLQTAHDERVKKEKKFAKERKQFCQGLKREVNTFLETCKAEQQRFRKDQQEAIRFWKQAMAELEKYRLGDLPTEDFFVAKFTKPPVSSPSKESTNKKNRA